VPTTESNVAQRRQRWKDLIRRSQQDPSRFNESILGRPAYWSRQRQVAQSVVDYSRTLVPTGNGVGKGYVASGLIPWFLIAHLNSQVIATSSSQTQLEEVLWKEVERAYKGSRIPLGGRLLKSPLKIDLGAGWGALAYSTQHTERFSGHHAGQMLVVVDEASGLAPEISEAIDSLNPSRLLLLGNPLRPDGPFFERCQRAETSPHTNLIRIPSTESPHVHLERSPVGLADRTWLENSRNDYGEGTLWWLSHVEALFPGQTEDQVIPGDWLDLAGQAAHRKSGKRRLAIDLAKGSGGDRAVLLVRDENGILEIRQSNTWTLEKTASQAQLLALKWGIEAVDVSFDVEGLGTDFANRLDHVSLGAARPYRGGNSGGSRFGNLRSAAAWKLRQRLDPKRRDELDRVQDSFALKPAHVALMRKELTGLRYSLDRKGRICLEVKEVFAKRLGHSPDFADTLGQSFAFPN
jgi:hypothetical protein